MIYSTPTRALNTVLIRIVAGRLFISRPIFSKNILPIFEKINIFENPIILADQKLILCTITINTVMPGGEDKNVFTTWGAIIRVGATIRVNTVYHQSH